jgi:hypothetical protein
MKSKILVLIFAIGAVLLSAQTAIEPLGAGTAADPYQITNLGNLYWISVNSSVWSKQFIQTADIDASETATWFVGDHDNNSSTPEEAMGWFGIGNSSSKFFGQYNGQGYKISNLYLNRKFGSNWGLFRYIYRHPSSSEPSGVKNLELVNATIKANDYVGGIAGTNEDSQISNCKVSGVVNGHSRVGGIAGYTVRSDHSTASIYKCENNATITGSGDSGEMVGGIAGENGNSKIEKCHNTGQINGNSNFMGGVTGNNSSASRIDQCYNTGNIMPTGISTTVGGLTGWNVGSVIIDSYNKGNISASVFILAAGGIVGKDIQGTITNCYNTGSISTVGADYLGGLVGSLYITHTNYCHWNSDMTLFNGYGESEPNSVNTGSSRVTSVELYLGNFENWNWTTIWQANTSEFPTLRDNTEQTLPVSLSSFSAVCASSETVSINWTTESESGLFGYNIYRNAASTLSGADRINTQLITAGNQSNEQVYNFTDSEVETNQSYYYWLQSVECNGSSNYYGPVNVRVNNPEVVVSTPAYSFVERVYPNPIRVNQAANVKLSIGQDDQGTLKIYNAKGQLVKAYTQLTSGEHQIVWNGKDENSRACSAGVYFYQLKSKTCQSTGKMLIIK